MFQGLAERSSASQKQILKIIVYTENTSLKFVHSVQEFLRNTIAAKLVVFAIYRINPLVQRAGRRVPVSAGPGQVAAAAATARRLPGRAARRPAAH